MQPGYTQDDFSQPAFCRVCGTHVPKTFLASSGGLCGNCHRNLQQMQGGQNPAMAYPGQFQAPRRSFFRSTGCVATIVGLIALSLLWIGASKYMKLPSLFGGSHKVTGVAEDIAKSNGNLVETTVDDASNDDIKAMATKAIGEAFTPDAVDPYGIGTDAVRDKRNEQVTYYASGNFRCMIKMDSENVIWRIGFQRGPESKWLLVSREAYYEQDGERVQFDFELKKFIHLAH